MTTETTATATATAAATAPITTRMAWIGQTRHIFFGDGDLPSHLPIGDIQGKIMLAKLSPPEPVRAGLYAPVLWDWDDWTVTWRMRRSEGRFYSSECREFYGLDSAIVAESSVKDVAEVRAQL